mmetsp:Transcript_29602/g.87752  ORF Transcript_29602/g.87752 Transcript_29602/m.87752 type:complete len:228 (-) Transcript_29602:1518-2201(-)
MNRSDPDFSPHMAPSAQVDISPFPGELRPPPLKKQCVGDPDRTPPTVTNGHTNGRYQPQSVEDSNTNSKWAEFDSSFQPHSSESAMYHSYMGLAAGIDATAAHQELFVPVHPTQVQGPSPYPSASSLGSNSDDANGMVSHSRVSPVNTTGTTFNDVNPPFTRPHAPSGAGDVSPVRCFTYSEQYRSIPTAVSDDSGCSAVASGGPVASGPYESAVVKSEEAKESWKA